MTQEEVFKQINAGAKSAGFNPQKVAEDAGYTLLPAPSPAAQEFLSQLSADFGEFTFHHTFPNGQELSFTFPCSITILRDLGTGGAEYAKSDAVPEVARPLGEDLIAAAWLMGQTNTVPGLDVVDFLRMTNSAGRAFFQMAPKFSEAFRRAMALQPLEDIRQGKDA